MQRRAEIALSLFVLGMALPLAAQDVPNTGPNQFEIGGFGGFSYGVDHSRGLQQAPTAGAAEDQRRKDKRWPHFPPGCSRRAAIFGAAEDQRRKRHGIPPSQMRQCFLKP